MSYVTRSYNSGQYYNFGPNYQNINILYNESALYRTKPFGTEGSLYPVATVFLAGRPFTIITDHYALQWLYKQKLKGRIARWIMNIQSYDFTIEHKAGKKHKNADALSRIPQK